MDSESNHNTPSKDIKQEELAGNNDTIHKMAEDMEPTQVLSAAPPNPDFKFSEAPSTTRSQSPSVLKHEPASSSNATPAMPATNFRHRYTLSGHTMSISSLKFSPNGSILASSGVFACPLLQYVMNS